MLSLFAAAFTAAAADCLNPVAITQQFILQGMVKKRWHIWAFILSVYLTNLAGGLLFYFGAGTLLKIFWDAVAPRFEPLLLTGQLILAVILFFYAGFLPQKWQLARLQNRVDDLTLADIEEREKRDAKKKVRSVRPGYLALLGAVNVILELPTALPYFTFLAVLLSVSPSLPLALALLFFYNVIFTLPLMALYFLSLLCKDKVDRFYQGFKNKIQKLLRVVMPLLLFLMGSVLLLRLVFNLLSRF